MTALKKILFFIISVFIITNTTFVIAEDGSVYKDPDGYSIKYVDVDGGIKITECTLDSEHPIVATAELVIPAEIDGKKVVELGTYITDGGFKTVTIEAEIEEMGSAVFADDSSIDRIVFPEGLRVMNDSVYNLNRLTSISLPDSLVELKGFTSCPMLRAVTIPDNVDKIGSGTFMYCDNLRTVTWDMTASECDTTFAQYTPWEETYGEDHEWLALNDGTYLVRYVGQGGDITVPKADKVEAGAAMENPRITGVTSEYGVADYMFARCENLETVNITAGEVGEDAFSECSSLRSAVLPSDLTVIPTGVFSNCSSLIDFEFPPNVEAIGSYAFTTTNLTGNIVIPESVSEIGSNAFYQCENITSVRLPENLTYLGGEAFRNCKSLESINIPYAITETIPRDTFWNCDSLTNVECDNITSAVYSATAETPWNLSLAENSGEDFFIINGELKKYNGTDRNPVIPDSVTIIGSNSFEHAEIDSVTIPSSVETIEAAAFLSSTLKSIVIPDTVKELGSMAFGECRELTSVIIEGDCKMGSNMFLGCDSLAKKDVQLPDGVTLRGDAFPNGDYDGSLPTDISTPDATPLPTEDPDATPRPTASASATPEPEQPTLTVSTAGEDIEVFLEDEKVIFPDAQPFVDGADRTQIPIRALGEMLGFTVGWNGETLTATLSNELTRITIKIGENTLDKNGDIIEMDTAAVVIDDRTYIPLRFVGEAFGYDVEWAE